MQEAVLGLWLLKALSVLSLHAMWPWSFALGPQMILSKAIPWGHTVKNGILFPDALCENALLYPRNSWEPRRQCPSSFLWMRICSLDAVHPWKSQTLRCRFKRQVRRVAKGKQKKKKKKCQIRGMALNPEQLSAVDTHNRLLRRRARHS